MSTQAVVASDVDRVVALMRDCTTFVDSDTGILHCQGARYIIDPAIRAQVSERLRVGSIEAVARLLPRGHREPWLLAVLQGMRHGA